MYDDPTDRQIPWNQLTTMTTSTIMKQTCAKIDPVSSHRKMAIYRNNDGNCNTSALLASIPTIQMEIMVGIVWQLKNMKNNDFY